MSLAGERLEHLCDRLRLPDVPMLLPEIAQEGVKGDWSFSDFAEVLLARQVEAADVRASRGWPASRRERRLMDSTSPSSLRSIASR